MFQGGRTMLHILLEGMWMSLRTLLKTVIQQQHELYQHELENSSRNINLKYMVLQIPRHSTAPTATNLGSGKHWGQHYPGESTRRTSIWLKFLSQLQFRSVSTASLPTLYTFQLGIWGPLGIFFPVLPTMDSHDQNVHLAVVSVILLVLGYKK